MSGVGQNGDLEARLRNLIVSNGAAAASNTDVFPKLPGKMGGRQNGGPQPRVLLPKQQDGISPQQPRRTMPPSQPIPAPAPQHGQMNANGQVPQVVGTQRRLPQKFRKFDEWQQAQPAVVQHSQNNHVQGHPVPSTPGSRQVLQNSSPTTQAPLRQAGPRPAHQQQSRGNHNAAAPSQFQPLQRQTQHTFNQTFTTQCQYLEVQAQRMLPQVEMKQEEFMMKDSFRFHLERSIQIALQTQLTADAPKISLACFGSLASGFGMPGSDMDLALLSSIMPAELPRIIEKIILDMGHGAHLLTRTRVPIIKVCESPTPELYQALCEERQKWDDMTPEEREQQDRGTKQEEAVKDDAKTGTQIGDDILGFDVANNHVQASDENMKQDAQERELAPIRNPANLTAQEGMSLQETSLAESTIAPMSTEAQPSIDTPASTINDVSKSISNDSPLITSNTNTTTDTSSTELSIATTPTKPSAQPSSKPTLKRKPWLRERKLGPLDFPKDGVGIQCDINFSNPLGLHNTTLLRCYSRCDVRVRLMILFIKSWASRRKINSARNGTLSSYGYVLMVLHYLVNIAQPPVCPNLQLAAQRQQNSTAVVIDGHTVHFWRNEAEIEQLAAKGMLTHNRQPLGVLLQGFFHYFAHQSYDSPKGGFTWTKEVLSLRSPGGLLAKAAKGWTGAKNITVHDVQVTNRYLFAIEDPFELDHNVARTVTHPGIVAIRDEFRRAWKILQFVGRAGSGVLSHDGELMDVVVEEVFDPEKEKEKVADVQNGVDAKEEENKDAGDVQGASSSLVDGAEQKDTHHRAAANTSQTHGSNTTEELQQQ